MEHQEHLEQQVVAHLMVVLVILERLVVMEETGEHQVEVQTIQVQEDLEQERLQVLIIE
jgi:hypothetical protein